MLNRLNSLAFVATLIMSGHSLFAQAIRCCCTQNSPSGPQVVAVGLNGVLWEPGETIRIRFLDGSPQLQQRVARYAQEWTNHANLSFEFVESGPEEIRISFTQGQGSWSYLGKDCRNIAPNDPTMNFGWFTDATSEDEVRRTTLHEFGHALGLIHEHLSPEARIPWNKPVVYEYYRTTQIPPWDREKTDHAIFRTYDTSLTNYSSFDPESIMIYAIPNEHTIGDFEVRATSRLSSTDIRHIQTLYPRGVVQQDKQITLTSIICKDKQEALGRDEVHLNVIADGKTIDIRHDDTTSNSRIPVFRLKDNEISRLNATVFFQRSIRVELWEIDNPDTGDNHDMLGAVTITASGPGSEHVEGQAGAAGIRSHLYQVNWQ